MVRLVFRLYTQVRLTICIARSLWPPPEFLWLRPARHSSPSSVPTGMLTLEPFSEDQGRSVVHPPGILPISFLTPYGFTSPADSHTCQTLGPCFKTGRMGSPQADALSTQMPRHAVRRVLQTTIKAATSPRA
ncbi:hypothetical protein Bca52824_094602 [Brassica carinata]|uniref:Uncharacterized protein n=1 Tax=Brassica carinata TaxID=52824 RepID=A0A8X7P543_BRACI|nr:hypothetical protein Bca52824_094602 [Brassica carinata]